MEVIMPDTTIKKVEAGTSPRGEMGQKYLVAGKRVSMRLWVFAEVIRPQELSKKELLERWALALERREDAGLRTLRETEYKTAEEQSALREENSPLTVAFEDPILRSAGLTSDRLGDAARFFGLSHWQLHEVVCNCHFGETVAPGWSPHACAAYRGVPAASRRS